MGIITGEIVDLAQVAHEVRWAFLIVNAAIPVTDQERALVYDGNVAVKVMQDAPVNPVRAADRSSLRAIAFKRVLAELSRCDFNASGETAQALREGQMPAGPQPLEERSP